MGLKLNAEGGIRTPTVLLPLVPETSASANSATSASYCFITDFSQKSFQEVYQNYHKISINKVTVYAYINEN